MAADKSPRSPSMSLPKALEKAMKIYAKERKNAVPLEVAAQDMGYSNANSGAALQALASLRYFGLLERPKTGYLAVSRDVEQYQFAPDEALKSQLRQKWMRMPAAFEAILQQFPEHMPSDANLRFSLISQGFGAATAVVFTEVFKESAAFADIYSDVSFASEKQGALAQAQSDQEEATLSSQANSAFPDRAKPMRTDTQLQPQHHRGDSQQAVRSNAPSMSVASASQLAAQPSFGDADQIPVRLSNGRKAWLIVPTPLYEHDKLRLKAQIDLLLTDELPDKQKGLRSSDE